MSATPLHDLAHPMLALAGLATLAALPVGGIDDFSPDSEPYSVLVTTGSYLAWALLLTVSFALLAVGIAGLAGHRGADGRTLGRSALALALVAAVIGYFQNATHAFVQPAYSVVAPSLIDEPPGGLLAISWLAGVLIMVVGLVTFGVSAYRTRVLPRPAAMLIIVGSVAFPVPSLATLLFGGGLLWAGIAGLRQRSATPSPDRGSVVARPAS